MWLNLTTADKERSKNRVSLTGINYYHMQRYYACHARARPHVSVSPSIYMTCHARVHICLSVCLSLSLGASLLFGVRHPMPPMLQWIRRARASQSSKWSFVALFRLVKQLSIQITVLSFYCSLLPATPPPPIWQTEGGGGGRGQSPQSCKSSGSPFAGRHRGNVYNAISANWRRHSDSLCECRFVRWLALLADARWTRTRRKESLGQNRLTKWFLHAFMFRRVRSETTR